MSQDYRNAVAARRRGDEALAKGDVETALKYYRRSLAALRHFRSHADPLVKKIVDKGIAALERDIERLLGKKSKGHKTQSGRTTASRGRTKKRTRPRAAAVSTDEDEREGSAETPEECEGTLQIVYPEKTFDDLAGMQAVKNELRLTIELPLRDPEEFKRRGVSPSTGILLYGPPGCGKTYLVTCAGGEFGLPVIIAKADQLVDMYVGNTEKNVAQVFRCARVMSPSIVFVDEIDTLLPAQKRGSDVMARAEGVFLQELSGVAGDDSIQTVFIGATNKPWDLNPALIRPGRIDRIVYVPAPDEKAREEIFKIQLRGNRLEGVDFKELARLTAPKDGYSYSSSGIAQICQTAVLEVIKEQFDKGVKDLPVEMSHITAAMAKIPRSITPEMEEQYAEFGAKFASFKT
ncbi:MAG: ATP-binding protein [Candidatus Thorarchaeota archaeon]